MKPAKKERLSPVTHAIRAAQTVLQYGVGAMVDFPDQTLMTAAPEYWAERVVRIHDERLEKVLHVDYFGMPGGKDEPQFMEGISFARFPEWYFCPKCRKFQPLSKWIEEYKRKANSDTLDKDPHMVKHMKCQTCKQELVVARVMTVCENGHIDDFPWVKWVHYRNTTGRKPICSHPSLTFKTGASTTEGLEGLVITCETCHARATLLEAFDPHIFERLDNKYGTTDFMCKGRHPWKNTKESCGKYPRAIQRGSSSAYFPVTVSSLVIPPFSDLINEKIEASSAFRDAKTDLGIVLTYPEELQKQLLESRLPMWANKIALDVGVSEEIVLAILKRKWFDTEQEDYTTESVKYRAEEYEALNGTAGVDSGVSRDFSREGMDISLYDIPHVVNVSLIHKIREVQALTGFSRLRPVEWSGQRDYPDGFVSIKEDSTHWYPAYEVRGEGIFIEFDQDAINRWASDNEAIQHRVNSLNNNYAASFLGQNHPRTVSAKFLMLHTLSHLLIKQLSFECGYSIASLRERIYCSEAAEGKSMAGILIYTASGDSEGTLGGLVRQGRPDCLPKIFKKALEGALTCSNDPVCSLSEGQGRDSLNLAACYSCTLIPETSCEEYNTFLDRGVLIGTFKNKGMGFFSDYIYTDLNHNGAQAAPVRKVVHKVSSPVSQKKEPTGEPVSVQHNGTRLSDLSLSEIWQYAIDNVEEPTPVEMKLISALRNASTTSSGKEDPLYGEEVKLIGSGDMIEADLLWEHAQVMIFMSDNEENYLNAKKSNWNCFLTDDPNLTANDVLTAIRGDA